MKTLKVGDFCFVDGEGLEVFVIIGETDTAFEVMQLNTGSCMESKSKCRYVKPHSVIVHSKPYWTVAKNPYHE